MGKTNGEHEFLRGDWVLEEMIKVALETNYEKSTGKRKKLGRKTE